MKNVFCKITHAFKTVFGYGIMICLFLGGFTFFGYLAAIIAGGDTGALICSVIYKKIIPVIIYASTVLVLFGLLIMYMSGEKALTADKKEKKKK